MDNPKKFRTSIGDTSIGAKLRELKISAIETKEPAPQDLGAAAARTEEEPEQETLCLDGEAIKKYKSQYTTKATADKNIKELQEKIKEKVEEADKEAQQAGEKTPDADEIILSVLKNHRHGTNPRGKVLVEFYEKKISDRKKLDASESEKGELEGKTGMAEPEKAHSVEPEKKAEDKNKISFRKFVKKYRNFFRKDVFSEFDEGEKEPKGRWMHVAHYNEKKGTIECYFGKVEKQGKKSSRYDEVKEIDLSELDKLLEGYKYTKTGKLEKKQDVSENDQEKSGTEKFLTRNEFASKYPNVIRTNHFDEKGNWVYAREYNEKTGMIVCSFGENETNKREHKKISLAELDNVLQKYPNVKKLDNADSNQSGIKEFEIGDRKNKEKIEDEIKGLGKICQTYYEMVEERSDWKYYNKERKESFLRSVVGSFAKMTIETKAEFLKDLKEEEKEQIIKKITQEIK